MPQTELERAVENYCKAERQWLHAHRVAHAALMLKRQTDPANIEFYKAVLKRLEK